MINFLLALTGRSIYDKTKACFSTGMTRRGCVRPLGLSRSCALYSSLQKSRRVDVYILKIYNHCLVWKKYSLAVTSVLNGMLLTKPKIGRSIPLRNGNVNKYFLIHRFYVMRM